MGSTKEKKKSADGIQLPQLEGCVFGPGQTCVSNAKLMRDAMDRGDNARAYRLVDGFINEYEKQQGSGIGDQVSAKRKE